MLKNLGFLSLIILIMISFTGCSGGSYIITVGEIDTFQNEMNGEYNSFTGNYFKKIKLEDGEALTVSFSAEIEQGDLVARIIDSHHKTIKTMKPGDTITLDEAGKYKMQVEGEKHKGSFNLSWEKE